MPIPLRIPLGELPMGFVLALIVRIAIHNQLQTISPFLVAIVNSMSPVLILAASSIFDQSC
jgi:drug/metabolite transporter (DMT)-like permease